MLPSVPIATVVSDDNNDHDYGILDAKQIRFVSTSTRFDPNEKISKEDDRSVRQWEEHLFKLTNDYFITTGYRPFDRILELTIEKYKILNSDVHTFSAELIANIKVTAYENEIKRIKKLCNIM